MKELAGVWLRILGVALRVRDLASKITFQCMSLETEAENNCILHKKNKSIDVHILEILSGTINFFFRI